METIQLTLNGRKRKEAADCVGTALGLAPVYRKAPSYAYAIGAAVIDRDGNTIPPLNPCNYRLDMV